MPDTSEIVRLIQSRIPLIVIESKEELQVLDILSKASTQLRLPFYRWTVTQGLYRIDGGNSRHQTPREPEEVLHHIWSTKISGLYTLVDFHHYLEEPKHMRMIKEIALYGEKRRQTIIFLSHQCELPDELNYLAAYFQLSLPSENKLMQTVAHVAGQWVKEEKQRKVQIDKEALQMLVQNLKGLTLTEAKRLARNAIYDDGAISKNDLPDVAKAKHSLLNKDGVLSFEYDTAHLSDVGGLAHLKKWLKQRQSVFLGKGKQNGLDIPKGILLLGIQGGGKSLAAKAVAGTWGVPLLRMDFGALFNKYFGETERRTREALKMAETMAPCVLWLDEIEKGIATSDSDNGTSKRLLGTLLTWMAERKSAVFIVATANDIQSLPPELLRKGRLDEIFFVDLPDRETRQLIFSIHLKKRDLDPTAFDLEQLADLTELFSGAEIEQAIVAGMYSAIGHADQLTNDVLVSEIIATQPLSVVMKEQIDYMREWARERTVPAH